MKLNEILEALNFFKQWKSFRKKDDREVTEFFLAHDKLFGTNMLEEIKSKEVLEKYKVWIDGRKINAVIKLKNNVGFTNHQIFNAYKAGFIIIDHKGKASFNIQTSKTKRLILAAIIFLVFATLTSSFAIFGIPSDNALYMDFAKLILLCTAIGASIFVVGTTCIELISNRLNRKLIESRIIVRRQ